MRSSKPAVILVGHGSRARGFDAAMKRVAAALRRTKRYAEVRCAFLEVSKPSIPDAIGDAVSSGAREVRVLPYFVLTGNHVVRDIPEIVRAEKKRHARVSRVVLCPYLGYHPKLVAVVAQRIREGR